MDISKTIAAMKADPAFADHVGMVLVHNGIVRGWSRETRGQVAGIKVSVDELCLERIRRDIEQMTWIYKVAVEARAGTLQPGDDLLFLVVAGDIRENVKPALALMLDRVKSEAVSKRELFK